MCKNPNMNIWVQVQDTPQEARKPIQAGRLKGMTDINPMWRFKKLTEAFGPCGIGWKYEIVNKWLEKGLDNEVKAFVEVSLYIKDGDKWSAGIPGIGGSSFVTVERNGPYCSDECYKMALTDAISVTGTSTRRSRNSVRFLLQKRTLPRTMAGRRRGARPG